MKNQEYIHNELRLLNNQIEECGKLSKTEKQENKQLLLDTWIDTPEVFADRIGWILNGTYGYGAMYKAIQLADNKRCNRIAGLSIILSAIEYSVTSVNSVKAWKELNKEQQEKLSSLIQAELDYFTDNRADFEQI